MNDRKRFDDDIVAPRKHIDRTEIVDLDPPDRAGPAPSLRERMLDRLGDKLPVIDSIGGDDDTDPPGGGPHHPIEVDIERPELDLAEREVIESPIDGGDDDADLSGLDLDRPRPTGFTYQKIESIVGGRADAGDGFTEIEWIEEAAQAQGYTNAEWHGDIAGVAAEADGLAVQIDGGNAGVVDALEPEM